MLRYRDQAGTEIANAEEKSLADDGGEFGRESLGDGWGGTWYLLSRTLSTYRRVLSGVPAGEVPGKASAAGAALGLERSFSFVIDTRSIKEKARRSRNPPWLALAL